jgi:hypothetical protein
MGYQEGEIYFVREVERTGKLSPFVKIGLVHYRESRDSFNRLAEHQTGNPRQLHLERTQIVKTSAVDMVEAQMHRIYSGKRISGEWFEFDGEAEVDTAVETARSLAAEAAELVPLFDTAEALREIDSTEGKRAPIEEELELGRQNCLAKRKLSLCSTVESVIKGWLVAAVDAGKDVSEVAGVTSRTYKPKFLESEFKDAYPDVYSQYLEDVENRKPSFLNKMKLDDENLDDDFKKEYSEIVEIVSSVTSHDDVWKLNEPTLRLNNLKGIAKWEEDISEAKLKIALDRHAEITGVCTWKRATSITKKFNSEHFAAENPELAAKFVSTPTVKEYVKAKKTKT